MSIPPLRLLYRGALSLPDSLLLLDGLTFTASPKITLLHNKLALALESMRGRPSLRFLGLTRLKDVWMEEAGDVCLDIHPDAMLSRIYFESTFCLETLQSSRSEMGVRVALGDSDGPETTEIIIFGHLPSSSLLSDPDLPPPDPPPITLHVARLTPSPPQPPLVQHHPRIPRPDDPTPRKPPLLLKRNSIETNGRVSKRQKVSGDGEDVRKARDVMLYGSTSASSSTSSSTTTFTTKKSKSKSSDEVFKVPSLPPSKGKQKQREDDPFDVDVADVFGGVRKGVLEEENKNLIKKSSVRSLTSHGITKDHLEFKELFGFVYRGSGFALRAQIKKTQLDARVLDKVVDAHVRMYIWGVGEGGMAGVRVGNSAIVGKKGTGKGGGKTAGGSGSSRKGENNIAGTR